MKLYTLPAINLESSSQAEPDVTNPFYLGSISSHTGIESSLEHNVFKALEIYFKTIEDTSFFYQLIHLFAMCIITFLSSCVF